MYVNVHLHMTGVTKTENVHVFILVLEQSDLRRWMNAFPTREKPPLTKEKRSHNTHSALFLRLRLNQALRKDLCGAYLYHMRSGPYCHFHVCVMYIHICNDMLQADSQFMYIHAHICTFKFRVREFCLNYQPCNIFNYFLPVAVHL